MSARAARGARRGRDVRYLIAGALTAAVAIGAGGCGTSTVTRVAGLTPPRRSLPPQRIAARPLPPPRARTLRRGAPLPQTELGTRVFSDRGHGFALALLASGATYPAVTADGGRTWHVAGPMLFSPPAGGPVAVDTPGMAGSGLYFAWLSDLGNVVDASADRGRRWWQTFFPGQVLGVLPTARPARSADQLTVVVAGPTSDPRGRGASLWEYRTSDGRRWSYLTSLNVVG